MIDKIGHYSMQNPPTVYDEEALTALELAARTAGKVNEAVDAFNKLESETGERLTQQDTAIENWKEVMAKTTIPETVQGEVLSYINKGEFDKAISTYLRGLNERVDNLLENVPEGGTTMDAEVIDLRVDANGLTHPNAGNAVRGQMDKLTARVDEAGRNGSGVYQIPLTWEFGGPKNIWAMVSNPFKVPEGGFSTRFETINIDVDGTLAGVSVRHLLGHMVEGEFQIDEELTSRYCAGGFTVSLYHIPYIDDCYACVQFTMLANGANLINTANHHLTFPYLDAFKVYAGYVHNSTELPGLTPACLRTQSDAECYKIEWAWTGLGNKWMNLASPLPLEFVRRVTVSHTLWIGAKVYKFDPVTRTTKFVETLAFHQMNPCFGSECVLDFSGYGKNYFAILVVGKVPTYADYKAAHYGTTAGVKGTTLAGLDHSEIEKGIFIEWKGAGHISKGLEGVSLPVQKNIELIKSLGRSVPPAMYNNPPNQYCYMMDIENFTGVFYGAGYQCGQFYYHVSPVAYYTALLNPNSVAYGDADEESGYKYGTICSVFTALLHGRPYPLSTFDMRYNNPPGFTVEPFDLSKDLHTVKLYDVLTQAAGNTGHCVLLNDIISFDNSITALKVMEAATPATRENVFFLHNGLDYAKPAPETWYQQAYDFIARSDPAADETIHDKANWTVPYVTPQKVMCCRGYGGLYIEGKTAVKLSIASDVESITITRDGVTVGTFKVSELAPAAKNRYNVVDVTAYVAAGTIRVTNSADDGVEEFHVINTSGYSVTAALDGDTLTISTNRNEDVKYINIAVDETTGHDDDGTAVNFAPAFDENGVMTINTAFITEKEGIWRLSARDNIMDSINVIFKTPYDTNTFCMDAEGDVAI